MHFEENTAKVSDTESEEETGVSSRGKEAVEEEGEAVEEEIEEEEEEVDETGKGKRKEDKASSFSTFSNILAQCSSKDSTTEEIFCASRRGCASQHPSKTCAKGSI